MKTHKTNKRMKATSTNPFDILTEDIIFMILDNLADDAFAKKSFSLVCKDFYSIESRHRKSLKPLRSELLPRTSRRYRLVSHLDLSLCPHVHDSTLSASSSMWKSTLRSINLSRSRFFTSLGLSILFTNCLGLVEVDLSNGTELTDAAAAAISEAKNLEKLWLGRCKLISDMGIGCIAVGCRNLKLLCLKWCLRITDLGVELVALKCKEIRSLDLSYLPIRGKCLSAIFQLKHLEDLVLEGCLGVNDDRLSTLKHSCKSLKGLNISNCHKITHVGLSSLTNGADSLKQLNLACGFAGSLQCLKVTADLAACLHNFPNLQSIKLDGLLVTCSGIKAIGKWFSSLKEMSLSKCSGVTDEVLSLLVQAHEQLRKLDITCCRKITYVSVDSITNSCSALTSLRMECCDLVAKDAFVLIGDRCRHLEELDVTCNEICNEGLKSISGCPKISSLKLGLCPNINDHGLAYVARGCARLRELDLYRCSDISDMGIEEIAHGCPELEIINIAYNDKISDTSLISLSKCSSLKELEIRGCHSVSSIGLSAIAKGCRQLRVLDVKKCIKINDNGMLSLARHSQNLKQINLSYCSVTDVGFMALSSINSLQTITILHLSGLTANGLAAALLACRGLRKVKLHNSFRSLLPGSLVDYMETHGCVFHWRDKAFQVEMDPKEWKLHFETNQEIPLLREENGNQHVP